MKILIMFFVVSILSIESFAQVEEGMPSYFDENGTEAAAVLLDREMGLPVCRFSDEVRLNPKSMKFLPDDRIDDIHQVNIDEVRVCQQRDVWEAALNDEEIVIAIAAPNINISFLMSGTVPIISFVAGSLLCDFFEEENNENKTWERFEENAYFGISIGVILHAVARYKELLPSIFRGSSASAAHIFFNPVIGTAVTALGVAACIM